MGWSREGFVLPLLWGGWEVSDVIVPGQRPSSWCAELSWEMGGLCILVNCSVLSVGDVMVHCRISGQLAIGLSSVRAITTQLPGRCPPLTGEDAEKVARCLPAERIMIHWTAAVQEREQIWHKQVIRCLLAFWRIMYFQMMMKILFCLFCSVFKVFNGCRNSNTFALCT